MTPSRRSLHLYENFCLRGVRRVTHTVKHCLSRLARKHFFQYVLPSCIHVLTLLPENLLQMSPKVVSFSFRRGDNLLLN